jgi:hypothetical protein
LIKRRLFFWALAGALLLPAKAFFLAELFVSIAFLSGVARRRKFLSGENFAYRNTATAMNLSFLL